MEDWRGETLPRSYNQPIKITGLSLHFRLQQEIVICWSYTFQSVAHPSGALIFFTSRILVIKGADIARYSICNDQSYFTVEVHSAICYSQLRRPLLQSVLPKMNHPGPS